MWRPAIPREGQEPGTPDLGSGNTLVNNSSLVLRLQYGEHVFLFMGDAEGKHRDDSPEEAHFVEELLVDTVPADRLRATVRKAAHHGSESGCSTPFLRAVEPEIVVVQSGRQSFNGRFIPDATTLERLCCLDNPPLIYRTDQNDEADGLTGANDTDGDHIVIRSNGQGDPEVVALEGGQPFTVSECEPSCSP